MEIQNSHASHGHVPRALAYGQRRPPSSFFATNLPSRWRRWQQGCAPAVGIPGMASRRDDWRVGCIDDGRRNPARQRLWEGDDPIVEEPRQSCKLLPTPWRVSGSGQVAGNAISNRGESDEGHASLPSSRHSSGRVRPKRSRLGVLPVIIGGLALCINTTFASRSSLRHARSFYPRFSDAVNIINFEARDLELARRQQAFLGRSANFFQISLANLFFLVRR